MGSYPRVGTRFHASDPFDTLSISLKRYPLDDREAPLFIDEPNAMPSGQRIERQLQPEGVSAQLITFKSTGSETEFISPYQCGRVGGWVRGVHGCAWFERWA